MRDGVFTEAFRGPARAYLDLGKFGLPVIWATLARLVAFVVLVVCCRQRQGGHLARQGQVWHRKQEGVAGE